MSKQATPADREWLERTMRRRIAIQRLGLLLLGLADNEGARTALEAGEAEAAIFGHLNGAIFSLWRAAFLTEPAPDQPRSTNEMIRAGREFLLKWLKDNSIAFGDEKTNRAWSVGYYMNNARFRLEQAAARFGATGSEQLDVAKTAGYASTDFGVLESEWDALEACAGQAAELLSRRLGVTN